MHPHPLASQAVTRRAEAPLSCNATLRQVVLDPLTHICCVCDGFWYLATFRTLTTLQRGSTRRFTCLVCRFGAPTCRLLFAERRVELSELPWTSRLKVSRQSRVRPTAIRLGLGAQALCARERHPVRPEPEPLDAPFLLFVYRHYTLFLVFVFASNRPRIESESRERPTHTYTQRAHTHTARAGARPGGSLEGSVCYCVHCILIHGYEQLDREAACMYTASRRQRGWTSGSCETCVSCYGI